MKFKEQLIQLHSMHNRVKNLRIIFGGKSKSGKARWTTRCMQLLICPTLARSNRESLQSVAFVRCASASGTKVHCGKLYCKASGGSCCSNSSSGAMPCAPFMPRPSCILQIILRAAARLRYIKFQFHVHLSRLWRGEAQHVGEGDEVSARAVPGAVLGTEVRMSVAELSQGRAARRKLFGQVAWRVNEGGRRRGRSVAG